ncbi:uncharacterized protein LOC119164146 [Rhipicephalus microplus]|uniref:uncharacterized protein LOC119164146 n=1 Tax=Rhipicephalus microplus TaxID=6941 RepID=UPI003F6C5A94
MGSEVHFRDLPGGPMKIKFADEITRHCLCKSCNMLSLTMYADPASHFFCETCILIQSYKHKRYDIYCPEERRNVSFEELFEARDVIMILRDQLVECPNRQNCTLKIPLEQLESHYIECMHLRSINCTKCGREVEATSWNKHKPDCKPTYDTKSTSQESNGRNNMRDHPVASQSKAQGLTSKKTGTAKHATGTSSGLYPVDQLRRMTNGDHGREPSSTETASLPPYLREKPRDNAASETEKTLCPYCKRKVKVENMERHLEICYDSPIECRFCNQKISKKDKKEHVQNCQRDFEKRSKEPKKDEVAKTIDDQPRPQPSHSVNAAYQGSKNIGVAESKGTASTKSSQATRQKPSLTSGCYTDWKAWKPYATSGNWYAVFIILEEQFRGTGADQAARWDHFVPKLRHTKHECIVRDLIDDPYEPQPFDCLITALIARCCLPQEVWPQGLQVTWDDIVMYVPSVLRERLTEGAKSHLRKHAVYLDSHGQPGIESSGAEAANAVVPRSPQLVASPNPATTETQAGSVKAVDVRSATQAKKQDANAISTLMQGEEAPSSKKAKKMSVADSLHVTSKLGRLNVSETATEAQSFQENLLLKSRGEPQEKQHGEGASQSQPGKSVRSLGGLGNDADSSERETSATITKLPSRRRSETSSSKLDDSSIAEPLPNSEELSDSVHLRLYGPPQQKHHVEVTSNSRSKGASRVTSGLDNNTCAPLGEINSPLDTPCSRFHTASPVSEPSAPSKYDEPGMIESFSNAKGLHDGPLGQSQEKLHVVKTYEGELEKDARLIDGLCNNAASSQCQNSEGVLFISPSEKQSEQSAPEPPASSKPGDLSVTENSSNIGDLREDKYSRAEGQSQQTLHADSTHENGAGAGAGLWDGLDSNLASLKLESNTVLSKRSSWNQSQHSAPEPPAHPWLGYSSANEAMPETEGWREGGCSISQGHPQRMLRAESTCEYPAEKSASLLDGRGNNTASSQRQNRTALSKQLWWYQSELSALPLSAPSKVNDLSTSEDMSTVQGLSAGEYIRHQDQLQQKQHVESSPESMLGETYRLLDELNKNKDSLERKSSKTLCETNRWKRSEPSAPEPPAYCEVDALKTTEALSNMEQLRGGEYLRPEHKSEEKLHVKVTHENRPAYGERFLDETGDNTAYSVRQNSTALSAPPLQYKPDSPAPEPPAFFKLGESGASEVLSNAEGLLDGTFLRSQCEPKLLYEDDNSAPLQQKTSTSLENATSRHKSKPLGTKMEEILKKFTTDGKHFSDVEQPCQKTYAEALKQADMALNAADACHIDAKCMIGSERSECYAAHKSPCHRTPGALSKEEAVGPTMPQERKMGLQMTTANTDRSPFTGEKGKTCLDRNAKENDTTARYSRARDMTIPNKSGPHLDRIDPLYCSQAPESRSTRSQRTTHREERVLFNSTRNSHRSRSGTVQQLRVVTKQRRPRYVPSSMISREVLESAGRPSEIPRDTSNAGTRHTSVVSRTRAQDQGFLRSSPASSTRDEETRVLERAQKVSKQQHDAGVASQMEGPRTLTCQEAPTRQAQDVTSGRVRRPFEKAVAVPSALEFSKRQDYSADSAASEATCCRASDSVATGSGFQLDIPCSQEVLPERTYRAFSCPADIRGQGAPELSTTAGYRFAKSLDSIREPMKERHESVLNSRECSQKDTSFVMGAEV